MAGNLKPIRNAAGLGLRCGFSKICVVYPMIISISKPQHSLDFESLVDLFLLTAKRIQEALSAGLVYFFTLRPKQPKNKQTNKQKGGKCLQEQLSPVFELGVSLLPSPFICSFPEYQKSAEAFPLPLRGF